MIEVNHKAARQLAKRDAGVGHRAKRQKMQRREGPNVREQGSGNLTVQLAKGGTVTLSESGRKNGNGAFFRLRDGACVSHKIAGGK